MSDNRPVTATSLLTIKNAAARLKCNREVLKGFALGMGVELQPVGNALCMSGADFERVRVALDAVSVATASN